MLVRLVVLFGAVTAPRLMTVLRNHPHVFPDTGSYVQQARHSPWDLFVVAGSRPPGTAWFLSAVGDFQTAIVVQTLVAGLAWTALIWAACSLVSNHSVRLLTGLMLGLTSLSSFLLVWDTAVLSDSLSLSFALLFIAALLTATRVGLSRWSGAAVLAAAAAAGAMRDTNAITVGLVGIALLLSLLKGLRRAWGAVALGLVTVLGLSLVSSAVGQRDQAVAGDELVRVLMHPDQTAFYVRRGLPNADVAIDDLQVQDDLATFRRDPRLHATHAWMSTHGIATKSAWVRAHLGYALMQPLREESAATAPLSWAYQPDHWKPALPARVESALFSRDRTLIGLEFALGVALLALGWRRTQARWVVLGALVSVPVQTILVWHGEAIEVPRHGVVMDMTLRVALVLAVAAGAEFITTAYSAGSFSAMSGDASKTAPADVSR